MIDKKSKWPLKELYNWWLPLTNAIFLINAVSTISPDQCCLYHFPWSMLFLPFSLTNAIPSEQCCLYWPKSTFIAPPPNKNTPKLSHSWLEVSNKIHASTEHSERMPFVICTKRGQVTVDLLLDTFTPSSAICVHRETHSLLNKEGIMEAFK